MNRQRGVISVVAICALIFLYKVAMEKEQTSQVEAPGIASFIDYQPDLRSKDVEKMNNQSSNQFRYTQSSYDPRAFKPAVPNYPESRDVSLESQTAVMASATPVKPSNWQ